MSQMFTAPSYLLSRMTMLRVKKFLNTHLCPTQACCAAVSLLLRMPVPSSQKANFPSTAPLGY